LLVLLFGSAVQSVNACTGIRLIAQDGTVVHAVVFSYALLSSKTGNDAVFQVFHVLNNFDIPKGAVRENKKDEHGNILADYTI